MFSHKMLPNQILVTHCKMVFSEIQNGFKIKYKIQNGKGWVLTTEWSSGLMIIKGVI